MSQQARTGYALAVVAAVISGVAIFVNSLGVKLFADSTTYTTLKNGVVGLLVLVPLLALPGPRSELSRLGRRQWSWMLVLAVIGGSVPFLLFFRGLQLSNAVSGSLINHLQFAVVAVLAAVVLRERIPAAMWVGLVALLAVTNIGINLGVVKLNPGTAMLIASTVLFAAGFVLAKHLLKGLSTTTVMAARMTIGAALLVIYSMVTGHLSGVGHLRADQWQFVLVTALILFAFTATTLAAIKRIPVTAVIAIAMAAPLVTVSVQALYSGRLRLAPVATLNLVFTFVVVMAIVVVGLREGRSSRTPASLTV